MQRMWVPPSGSALRIWVLSSATLSVAIFAAFAFAIGDPTGFAATAHGNWRAGRFYYGPLLATCGALMALIHPEASVVAAPTFAGVQVLAALVLGLREAATNPLLYVLVIPFMMLTIVPWVVGGALFGLTIRLVARAFGKVSRR
jgi:uncharacterized membrane protein YvlD (DUF360 family)